MTPDELRAEVTSGAIEAKYTRTAMRPAWMRAETALVVTALRPSSGS